MNFFLFFLLNFLLQDPGTRREKECGSRIHRPAGKHYLWADSCRQPYLLVGRKAWWVSWQLSAAAVAAVKPHGTAGWRTRSVHRLPGCWSCPTIIERNVSSIGYKKWWPAGKERGDRYCQIVTQFQTEMNWLFYTLVCHHSFQHLGTKGIKEICCLNFPQQKNSQWRIKDFGGERAGSPQPPPPPAGRSRMGGGGGGAQIRNRVAIAMEPNWNHTDPVPSFAHSWSFIYSKTDKKTLLYRTYVLKNQTKPVNNL